MSQPKKTPTAEFKRLLGAKYTRKVGYRERGLPVISYAAIRTAERVFWRKRGLEHPPGTLTKPFGHFI
jgi:hypothetical protein